MRVFLSHSTKDREFVQRLADALTSIATVDAPTLAKMSAAGYAYCAAISWSEIAKRTFTAMKTDA